ncbi:carbohydrate sulfotransferase 15-like isoform X1 [Lates japonicus]|uniref:Carbohydrate sulfotransferase 15-like isoform X1 n=1 Tax=Lates japonicus TaxID=270547 RepID=A0AAD3N0W9_LATJO|nr:carbohydrate sulfotransferase 15-like isoform X1 [Lates japonicus]
MSLSDCKYGSNTQRDHNCSLHSFPMSEDYGKRPVRTFFDFRHTNVPENQDVKWVSLLSLTNLRSISKVRLVSFLLGLTLTFLIMASYILQWDKKGLLFTPAPYQLRPVVIPTSTTAAAAEVSSEKNIIDMKLLVKIIGSKLEYTPRKVPDEKDITETDSHGGKQFACWLLADTSTSSMTVRPDQTCSRTAAAPETKFLRREHCGGPGSALVLCPSRREASADNRPVSNTAVDGGQDLGPMLPATRASRFHRMQPSTLDVLDAERTTGLH